MNENSILQLVKRGFHIGVGAVASSIETIQNPQKRSQAIAELQTELSQKTQEWAAKGEVTEAEAKTYLDSLLQRQGENTVSTNPTNTPNPPSYPAGNNLSVNSGLQELTEEIIALKLELEKLRQAKETE